MGGRKGKNWRNLFKDRRRLFLAEEQPAPSIFLHDPHLHTEHSRLGCTHFFGYLTMPSDHGLGLDNHPCGSPARPHPGQPNPQQAVRSAPSSAMAASRALEDQELMAQGQDFSLQSHPRSEERRHGEKQGKEKGNHGSRSLPAAALQIQPLQ
jgi:hypothetical protein